MILPSTIIRHVDFLTDSPQRNPAVHRCCLAAVRALEQSGEEHPGNRFEASEAVITAYRDAMPSLDGAANIRDYIACIAQGMLLGVIDPLEGPKFLYAAQMALSALPRRASRRIIKEITPKTQTPPLSPSVTP